MGFQIVSSVVRYIKLPYGCVPSAKLNTATLGSANHRTCISKLIIQLHVVHDTHQQSTHLPGPNTTLSHLLTRTHSRNGRWIIEPQCAPQSHMAHRRLGQPPRGRRPTGQRCRHLRLEREPSAPLRGLLHKAHVELGPSGAQPDPIRGPAVCAGVQRHAVGY